MAVVMFGNALFYSVDLLSQFPGRWPTILYWIILKLPSWAWMIIPPGALFGAALAASRLSRDCEITVLRSSGISVKRFALPFLVIGMLLSLVYLGIQEKVVPWAEKEGREVITGLYKQKVSPPVQENVFFTLDNYCFYVRHIDRERNKQVLKEVMIYEFPLGVGFPSLTTAASASQENGLWVLRNGVKHKLDAEGYTEYDAHFDKATLDLRTPAPVNFSAQQKTLEEMTATELARQVKMFSTSNPSSAPQLKTAYHFKLSIPFCAFLLVLCTTPMCVRFGRTGYFTGVLIGIAILALYWNLVVFGRVLGNNGVVTPPVAAWSVVGFFGLLGIYFLWKSE